MKKLIFLISILSLGLSIQASDNDNQNDIFTFQPDQERIQEQNEWDRRRAIVEQPLGRRIQPLRRRAQEDDDSLQNSVRPALFLIAQPENQQDQLQTNTRRLATNRTSAEVAALLNRQEQEDTSLMQDLVVPALPLVSTPVRSQPQNQPEQLQTNTRRLPTNRTTAQVAALINRQQAQQERLPRQDAEDTSWMQNLVAPPLPLIAEAQAYSAALDRLRAAEQELEFPIENDVYSQR